MAELDKYELNHAGNFRRIYPHTPTHPTPPLPPSTPPLPREEQDKAHQKWVAELDKYELNHAGNFRRIYPEQGSEKYDKFFHNSGSLYQETAACKARSMCARFVMGGVGG